MNFNILSSVYRWTWGLDGLTPGPPQPTGGVPSPGQPPTQTHRGRKFVIEKLVRCKFILLFWTHRRAPGGPAVPINAIDRLELGRVEVEPNLVGNWVISVALPKRRIKLDNGSHANRYSFPTSDKFNTSQVSDNYVKSSKYRNFVDF